MDKPKRRPLTGHETLIEVAERTARAYAEDKTQVVHYDVDADINGTRMVVHFLVVARPVAQDGRELQHTPI